PPRPPLFPYTTLFRSFRLTGKATIRTLDGRWFVRPLGKAMALGALPLEQARPGIVAALEAFARGAAYERWSAEKQDAARKRTVRSEEHTSELQSRGHL